MNKRGLLLVVSGFSGAGKGTMMKQLLGTHEDAYALSVSATSRAPRPGEVDKVHYFFVSKEEFEGMIAEDALIEYAQYVGNYYGTPRAYVEEQLSLGKNVILEIEIQGALKIKEKYPDTKLIFISAPSAKELKDRLVGRGTESEEVIESRLSRAYEESLGIEEYDYFIINGELVASTELLHQVICNEQLQQREKNEEQFVSHQLDFINNMRNELKSFSKGE